MKKLALLLALIGPLLFAQEATIGVTPIPEPDPLNIGLVACYPFDSDYSDVVGGHDLAPITNSPSLVGGLYGSSVQFTESGGVDGLYVADTQSQMEGTGAFTYVLWYYGDTDESGNAVWSYVSRATTGTCPNFELRFQEKGDRTTMQAFGCDGAVQTNQLTIGGAITGGQWIMVTIRHDGATTYTFDRNATYAASLTKGLNATEVGFSIGRVGGASGIENGGTYRIDEARVYNYSISTDTETALFNSGAGVACPAP